MSYKDFSEDWGGEHSDDMDRFDGVLRVKRVRLDSGGYTSHGRYFGVGDALWRVFDDEGDVDFYIRARSVSAAKDEVQAGYPRAKVVSA